MILVMVIACLSGIPSRVLFPSSPGTPAYSHAQTQPTTELCVSPSQPFVLMWICGNSPRYCLKERDAHRQRERERIEVKKKRGEREIERERGLCSNMQERCSFQNPPLLIGSM